MVSPAEELTAYLHQHIPLTSSMQMSVRSIEEWSVVLAARLAPNLNHERTAFGGSISAVAMLAGWSILRQRFFGAVPLPTLVVQRSETRFDRPVTADFEAQVIDLNAQKWDEFQACLRRYRKARIELNSTVTCRGEICARLRGRYVAMFDET